MYVGIQRLSETSGNKIWETRLRESEHRWKFVWVQKAEWWESVWSSRPREKNRTCTCMLVSRGWAKRAATKIDKPGWGKVNTGQILFGSRRLSDESQFGRAGLAKGNESFMYVGGWAKGKPIKFEKPGWGKVNPGQNLFRSTRLSDESQFGWADEGKRILYVCWCQKAERNERK